MINNIHVKLITSKILPAQFKVLVTKYLITVEVSVKLLNLNIVNFKAAGEAQLKMIKYDIDYQFSNGRVIVGLCNLWMLHDLVKVCICCHSLFHSLPWSGFLSCMAVVCSWLLHWLCSAITAVDRLPASHQANKPHHTLYESRFKNTPVLNSCPCDTHCTSGIMNTLKLDQEPQVKTIVNINMATIKAAEILETSSCLR